MIRDMTGCEGKLKETGGGGVLLPPLTKVCDASRMSAMHRWFMAAEMSGLFNLNFCGFIFKLHIIVSKGFLCGHLGSSR